MRTSRALLALKQLNHLADPGSAADLSDGELLERFRRHGEQAAFTLLLQRHGPMVLSVCRRVLGNHADAEDAFQATFLVLARHARTIRRKASAGSWLYGVARQVALKALRTAARRHAHERARPAPAAAAVPEAELKEQRRVVEEELGRLPEKYRAPVVLCYLEEKTHDQAARELGCPKSSLTSRLGRARELLQSRLSRRGLALPAAAAGLLLEDAACATVPAALVLQSVRVAAGGDAGCVSAPIAALARGAPAGSTAVRWLAGLALAAVLAGMGVLAASGPTPDSPPAGQPGPRGGAVREAPKQKGPGLRVDLHGDPLPAGAVARLGTRRLHYPGVVYAAAYSPDGKLLASAGDSGGVVLWEADTGKEVRRLRGGANTYISVGFLRRGKEVIAGRDDGFERWETATGRRLGAGPRGTARYLTVAPDGKTLATCASGVMHICDAASLRVLHAIRTPVNQFNNPLSFSADGKLLAAVLIGGKVGLWQTASGKPAASPLDHLRNVYSLAFARDRHVLATAADEFLRLWDVKTGKELRRLPRHKGYITALAFAPGGKALAVAWSDGTVRVSNPANGKELWRWDGCGPVVRALAFSADGKTLASGGEERRLRLWDAATGKERSARPGHAYGAYAVGFLPDSRTVVTAGRRGVRLWRAATGEGLGVLTALGYVGRFPVGLRADGRVAAVYRQPKKVEIWDLPARKLVRELKCPPRNAVTLSLQIAAQDVLCLSGPSLQVCGPPGRPAWEAPRDRGELDYLSAVSQDGKRVAALVGVSLDPAGPGLGYRLDLWDAGTGKRLRSWARPWDGTGLPAHPPGLALSPDGSLVAVVPGPPAPGRTEPSWPVVYEAATGRRVRTLEPHRRGSTAVAFSPDGRLLATGGEDGSVAVWEAATGKRRVGFGGHAGPVTALAFSPDGRLLASACWAGADPTGDPTVLLWDLTGRLRQGRLQAAKLTAEKLAGNWEDLLAVDAARANRALWELAAAPREAVAFLATKLRPRKAADAARLQHLVKDLGASRFAVRSRAEKELKALAELAEEALRGAAGKGSSLEVQRRADRLLRGLTFPSGEALRTARALEALERCGAEARPLLKTLAGGAPGARVTREARAILVRLAGK
jgi:RNA polymerase sigma factor (sigma-70 family)